MMSWTLLGQDYQKTDYGIKVEVNSMQIELQFFSPQIVRVLKHPNTSVWEKESLSVIKSPDKIDFKVEEYHNVLSLRSAELEVLLNTTTGDISFRGLNKRPLLVEKSGATTLTAKDYKSGATYEVSQTFMLEKQEAIYGLGQHQHGKLNQRNTEVRLRQVNTEIAVPIVHSVKGYAIFWDNYSPTTFNDSIEGLSFTSEAGEGVDYYFMYGGNADGVIAQIRDLTGQAPMFPLWTYGYWQSRERYTSQEEIVGVVEKYRDLEIPLDGIVQDWQYWGTDNKNWNAVSFDNPKFDNPKKMIDDVHKLNAHIMISVWPSFGPLSKIHQELKEKDMLLKYETYPSEKGVRIMDVFNPEARDVYWKYMNKNIFSLGMDGWWLDATEPEENVVGEEWDEPTYLGAYRNISNAFPLLAVKGVYENQRATTSDKRVFILTRSAFAGQQRYGANSWSGDIVARWDVLKNQISAGLNFSLTGIPYWNADIGGFWADRVYPEGVKDIAYHELYVRWLQFGTFTPMMRSHGTNTPREIFQFGERGDWAFDAIEKYIKLRYNLLPYIYSTSYDVTQNAGTMMRALSMDFATDAAVHSINDQFMFGKSMLIAPVTDSMYVNRVDGESIEDFSTVKSRKLYLPKRTDWYDFWSGEKVAGGKSVTKDTPISIMPIYIKAGTILPWAEDVQYAEEKKWDNLDLFVFSGADGSFTLYEDENNNYNYEEGLFSTIKFDWDDKKQTLKIAASEGAYPNMLSKRTFNVILLKEGETVTSYSEKKTISYKGIEQIVKF